MSEHETGVVMATASGDGVRVLLSGDLDADACERLAAVLADVCAPRAAVTVDLSRAGRLPLAALRCLAAAHRMLVAGGGRLVLANPSPGAVRSLRISGLHRVLDVADRRPADRVARDWSRVRREA